MSDQVRFTVKLFYSYSHKDQQHRKKMEKALSLLRDQDRILEDWSDQKILPGQHITEKIRERMQETDIFAFLLSQDFIASEPCMEEWNLARKIASKRHSVFLVPIILSDCSWKDMEGMSQLKALPIDGKPIKNFQHEETGWLQVYEGLKDVINHLRKTFTIKEEYRKEMEKTEFLSQDHIPLLSIFVFPAMSSYAARSGKGEIEKTIGNKNELLKNAYSLVHGERLSGKTALCCYLFLTLVNRCVPVLYIDLDAVDRKKANPEIFRNAYQRQFHGDHALWNEQSGKVIILDNLSPRVIDHVALAMKHFDQVIMTVATDTFYAYFRDDDRLLKFIEIRILPLTHSKQEELIRKRTELLGQDQPVLDGQIDAIENRVNEVIINNKILPRFPFYVLSILQTYEAYMPRDLSITSYGHCYYVFIIAHFSKSGISKSDDEINACFNFVENLAFEIYCRSSKEHSIGRDLIDEFKEQYGKKFIPLKESTFSRLFDADYGILKDTGQFRSPYMYYFFLGKYLAKNSKRHEDFIQRMIERSYIVSNCLTLIFMIHHTNDDQIVDEILLHTMCVLDNIEPAVLDHRETKIFEDIVKAIPSQILSRDPVPTGREKARNARDHQEPDEPHELENTNHDELTDPVNDVYRIMKNNEILGQVLKNKYGSLEREKVAEIIETIADGGLRLVRLILGYQNEMNDFAVFVHKRNPELNNEGLSRAIRVLSFLWTIINVEKIVGALNKPDIRPLVEKVVANKNTPAYELIEYFLRLDTMQKFSDKDREKLQSLLNKHHYPFFQKVISLRTQHYLNTHNVRTSVEQRVCSLLNIKYQPRFKKPS